MSITDRLCEKYDQETLNSNDRHKLYIVGDSPFTRAIKRKADQLGVSWFSEVRPGWGFRRTIVDREVYRGEVSLIEDQDVDNLVSPGLSCCAQAILDTLLETGVSGKAVTIIGRGHAVKGLAQALIDHNATVTVAHSKTGNLYEAALFADILVLAAPIHAAGVLSTSGKTVVDVAGVCNQESIGLVDYIGPGDIGRLTTSIVLYRAEVGNE